MASGEEKFWSKTRQRIVTVGAEQAGFVMPIGRRQPISLRQADLADLLGAALGSAITGINTCCAAALVFYGLTTVHIRPVSDTLCLGTVQKGRFLRHSSATEAIPPRWRTALD